MRTAKAVDVIAGVLAPHIGETTARAATSGHCGKLGLERAVRPAELEVLLGRLQAGLNVFVGRTRSAEVIAEARRALAVDEEKEP